MAVLTRTKGTAGRNRHLLQEAKYEVGNEQVEGSVAWVAGRVGTSSTGSLRPQESTGNMGISLLPRRRRKRRRRRSAGI
ncbi:hypothetical protein E2C01_070664 [Portunus trituberculatus]|uniref:Uncharacterized protein n=1 Tax=Portunus trituberculatus TaxID=210409 RepID=A0A5B7I436_PORTR|nr:hypothetical protein [Portunus trituberculatus]